MSDVQWRTEIAGELVGASLMAEHWAKEVRDV